MSGGQGRVSKRVRAEGGTIENSYPEGVGCELVHGRKNGSWEKKWSHTVWHQSRAEAGLLWVVTLQPAQLPKAQRV
jgi:hypothetical protein